MPWARASALHRHLECPAASWYDRAERGAWKPGYLTPIDALLRAGERTVPPDDGVLAQWGTEMHLAKEGSPKAADPWLSWVEPHRERLWPAGLGEHEVAWSYDCRTGIVTLFEGDRDDADAWKQARGPSCVTGTTDWHAKLPGGEPWVDDLKTGYPVPSATTPQMMCYGLVAAKVAGYDTVRLSVTHWRRGWESPDRYWQQVGPAALSAFEDELRAAWRRAVAGPDPRGGTWCRYCPSALVCPTVTGDRRPVTGE